jgi:hypothetical protein
MEVNRVSVKPCNCGKPFLIFQVNQPVLKTILPLLKEAGFKESEHFTRAGILYVENSNFVVTTYWWGSGNYNQNTARPCIFFYENIIKTAINILVEYMIAVTKTVIKDNPDLPIDELNNRINNYTFNIINKKQYNTQGFNVFIDKKTKDYNGMIYEYCKLDPKDTHLDQKSMIYLEKLKASGKTPSNFEYKNATYVKTMLLEVIDIIYKICIYSINY